MWVKMFGILKEKKLHGFRGNTLEILREKIKAFEKTLNADRRWSLTLEFGIDKASEDEPEFVLEGLANVFCYVRKQNSNQFLMRPFGWENRYQQTCQSSNAGCTNILNFWRQLSENWQNGRSLSILSITLFSD